MIIIKEVWERLIFWKKVDRIGPDILLTHWRLYFPSLMRKLCKDKFLFFSDSAEFRPGAYAIGCSKISIGSRVIIRPQTMIFSDPREEGKGVIIEDDAMIGSGVHIYTNNHNFDNQDIAIIDQGHYESREVLIEKGSWIGANAIILPGVKIGINAVVGAGSVVVNDVPAKSVVAGSPAKILKFT
jgi:acetyltransferase-like isoleucine patch superfamily enzyme